MIISHKHKFIFIKTHKTATQTFYNVIKPELGPDDILIGDERVPSPDGKTFYDTSLNVDKCLYNGQTGGDIRDRMGNHIPWFTIKEAVGDDVWNEYTKFTIERPALDRLVSLFCFLNPLLVRTKARANSKLKEDNMDLVRDIQSKTPLENQPDAIRTYFERWVEVQLNAPVLDLTDPTTYSAAIVQKELEMMKQSAKELGHDVFFYDRPARVSETIGQTCFRDYPPLSENILVPDGHHNNPDRPNVYKRYLPYEGQCRFLNYGYYHDGNESKVDRIINFNDITKSTDRFNQFFTNNDINITLTQDNWNELSLNTQFRSKVSRWGIGPLPKTEWWYGGLDGDNIKKHILNTFAFIKY